MSSKLKIRVLHCITSLDPDGAQRMLLKVCQHMDAERFEIRVVNLRDPSPFAENFTPLGIPVEHLRMRPNRFSLAPLQRMKAIIEDFRPDVLQGWMYHSNVFVLAARAFSSYKPTVLWNIRTSVPHVGKHPVIAFLTRRLGAALSSKAAKVLYQGRQIADAYASLGYCSTNQVIIPNGFQTEMFRPLPEAYATLRASLGVSLDTPIVGSVGRYHPTKDQANFLRMAAEVSKALPAVHFVMAGREIDGDNAELLGLSAELGLGERLHLLGEQKMVQQLLPAFDVFVQSSRQEGFPNSLGEAMSCGVPSVSTAAGGSKEIMEGVGPVVPIEDSQALGAAVCAILRSSDADRRRLGELARERVIERFALPVVAAAYENLYAAVAPKVAAEMESGTEPSIGLQANSGYRPRKDAVL